jgi:hypothetical protein
MTSEYTFVTAERQNVLRRRIQQKLVNAAGKDWEAAIVYSPISIAGARDGSSTLDNALGQTSALQ